MSKKGKPGILIFEGITLRKRSDDWHACINGDERLWGCGKTIDDAIGNVVRTHKATLGLTIEEAR